MADSTLTLDKAAGGTVPLAWTDDKGAEIDISAADVMLYVNGGFSIVPGSDPNNSKGRLFEFTPTMAQSLGSNPHDYLILIDGTPARGWIVATGFVPE
ncbi:hypothetical protein U1701_00095 [Sphingomonas sp. PB2P19]|uniref:hypothetical protein n=1 Tax=Sphingomonas rhamnosi TaxID=3096156 RepID=UPI002FC7F05F